MLRRWNPTRQPARSLRAIVVTTTIAGFAVRTSSLKAARSVGAPYRVTTRCLTSSSIEVVPSGAMHAIRLHELGPASNLRWEEVPDPHPGHGEVRIDVAAAGVHLVDTTLRSGGDPRRFPSPDLPYVPGREVAGVVDDLGPGVDRSWLGRRVVAHLGMGSTGGYAERAVARATSLHAVPDHVADDLAVAMIGTGRTAVGILDASEIAEDDTVLVTAAAGGIGTLLVQAAIQAGAFVIGLAGGPGKVERVRAQGADVAFDYRSARWTEDVTKAVADTGRSISLALDGVGGEAGRAAFDLLGPGGRMVLFGFATGTPTPFTADDLWARGLSATVAIGPRMLNRPGGLRPLEVAALEALADGRLTPTVHRFPMHEAAAAHDALEQRATTGKVVLVRNIAS